MSEHAEGDRGGCEYTIGDIGELESPLLEENFRRFGLRELSASIDPPSYESSMLDPV